MVSIDRDRLRALIQERGTTARAVSRALGSNDTLLRDILSGKSKNARGDTMAKIADHLGVPVSEFFNGIDLPDDEGQAPQLAVLPMVGPVQAGAWLALDDSSQDEPQMLSAALDRRYPSAKQWLREVRGDSMNARNIFPGDLVHMRKPKHRHDRRGDADARRRGFARSDVEGGRGFRTWIGPLAKIPQSSVAGAYPARRRQRWRGGD